MYGIRELLADLWRQVGGDIAALQRVALTGNEPQLPSSFHVGAAAQVSIAAAGMAAAEIWRLRSGQTQTVSVDMRHAIVECRSERYLRCDGNPPPPAWDAIAGVYKTGDGKFVRLHTNFPHHRDAVCQVLSCAPEREAVQAALMQWNGEAFETAAYAAGGVVALMRSHDEWMALPQAKAVAELPLVEITRIGDAEPKLWPIGARPLAGLRVLDLHASSPVPSLVVRLRPMARMSCWSPAPICRRSRGSPSIPAAASSRASWISRAGRGATPCEDCSRRRISSRRATARNRSRRSASRRTRRPVSVPVSSMSRSPPMAVPGRGPGAAASTPSSNARPASTMPKGRRPGVDGPRELPAQMLDHATGYLMAFGAMIARARQAREGGSWHVQVSLARTGQWLWDMGRIAEGLAVEDLKGEMVKAFTEDMPSGFGQLSAVRHAAVLSRTPASWARPAMPLGSHPAVWPSGN